MSTAVLTALYEGRRADAERLAAECELSLPEAAALGDAARCRALLDAGARVEDPSPDGWPPLHLAAFFGRADVVDVLLAHQASPTVLSTSAQGNSALHAALAGMGDQHVVDALLRAGADVNAPDAHQVRPIHLAASRGNIALLEQLVQLGARIDEPMADGTRASDLAVQRGHEAAGTWLTERSTRA